MDIQLLNSASVSSLGSVARNACTAWVQVSSKNILSRSNAWTITIPADSNVVNYRADDYGVYVYDESVPCYCYHCATRRKLKCH